MMPGGPFTGQIGKTFAPTAAGAAEAQQTRPLSGEQQAVKVLRFNLPTGNPNAPSADALLQPKLDTNVNADHAVLTSVLRAMLGPGAPAFAPGQSPLAANPNTGFVGNLDAVAASRGQGSGRDDGPSVSGAGGGSSSAPGPGDATASILNQLGSLASPTPNIAFSGGDGNDVPLPPRIDSTLSEAPDLGGPFTDRSGSVAAAPSDSPAIARRPWLSSPGGPF